MKQTKHIIQIPALTSTKYKLNDRDDANLESVFGVDFDEVDKKLKEIDSKIENIGYLCDKKKQRSLDEMNSVIKKEKTQILDNLANLNVVLSETVKQNTKDNYLNSLKKDVAVLKSQVHDKDDELKILNDELYKLENKFNYLREEKGFLSKEINNAKTYNQFLKSKLSEYENTPRIDMSYNNSTLVKPAFTTIDQNSINEKIELYMKRNENILLSKIANEEKVYKERIYNIRKLEKCDNTIIQVLGSKLKEYQTNIMQNRFTNEEIFFTHSDKNFNKKKANITFNKNSAGIASGLNRIDKKEIVKQFLEDIEVKRYIYNLLYDGGC